MARSATSRATGCLPRRFRSIATQILIFFLVGCARDALRDPAAVYLQADRYRRSGDLKEALDRARHGYEAWSGDPRSTWHWKFRLLTAELFLLQRDPGAAAPLLAGALPPDLPELERFQARHANDCGYSAYLQRNSDQARGLLDQALELAMRSSSADLAAQIRIARGYVHLMQGHPNLMEEDFRAAVTAAQSSGDSYLIASALSNMGYLLVKLYRYDEAIQWSTRSLELSAPGGYHLITARNLVNQGWSYYRLGDLEKAEKFFEDAERRFAQSGRWDDQLTAIGNIGSVYYARFDYPRALTYYLRALDTAEKHQLDSARAIWLNNIASTYIEMGDLDAAEPYNRRTLELQSRLHDDTVSIWPMLNAAQIALVRSDYDASLKAYTDALQANPADKDLQWETHDGLAQLYSRRGDPDRADREFQTAIAIIDASWSSLRNDQSKLTFPTRLSRFDRRYVDFLMAQDRTEDALRFVESRRARLLAESLESASGPAPEPRVPASASFQSRAREAHAVLFSFWLAPKQSYLWVTTPDGLHKFDLGPERHISDLVDRYASAIVNGNEAADTGRALYQLLVAPAQRLLPPGGRVVLVPDGCLHGLNFETLLTPQGEYWIQNAAVEIAPSLTLFRQGRASKPRRGSILLIGDPVSSSLPELPNAGREIAAIAGLYGDTALAKTREQARPESYRAAHPGQFTAIHFAAHAVPNRDSPLDSAVVLSPGADSAKLYAREVQDIRISANLVTISACSSAGARTYPGEGLVGFAWAFLHAGASNVVASLWDVSDQSTAAFMQALYTHVRRGDEPVDALRQVKLDFIHSHDVRRKPYYWAPFQIYVR